MGHIYMKIHKREPLSEEQLAKLWKLRDQGLTNKVIAQRFGYSESQMSKVLRENPRPATNK